MQLEGKRVIVVGLGKSGFSAAKLCVARGARVLGTDRAPREGLPEALSSLDMELRTGGHEGVEWQRADLIVMSPGVPLLPEVARAREAGVEVIGELELSSRFIAAPIVAVGGTNGKSTVTTLLTELLKTAGFDTFVGANLGTPAAEAAFRKYDVVVFEVSSFQLEYAPTFRPKVSVLLNVTEDHLDRYSSFAEYADAKGNAFENQGPDDVAIYNAADPECERQARRGRGRCVTFGTDADYAVGAGEVIERSSGTHFSLADSKLYGTHNWYNAAAAIAAARALCAEKEAIVTGLQSFEPLAHRMALVRELSGVRFYDDSKATNVGAAVTALLGLVEQKAVLIAGGRDKLGSYEPLAAALRQKGRAAVLIGEAADRIALCLRDVVPVARASTMEEAVRAAAALALPGDAVLLSPACSSFDMFRDYAERGVRFADAVVCLEAQMGKGERAI